MIGDFFTNAHIIFLPLPKGELNKEYGIRSTAFTKSGNQANQFTGQFFFVPPKNGQKTAPRVNIFN